MITSRRNPDGSLTVGIIEEEVKETPKTVEVEKPKAEKPKTAPKKTAPKKSTSKTK